MPWCANSEHHDVNGVVSMGQVGEQNGGLRKVACPNAEGDVLEVEAVAQPLRQFIAQPHQTPAMERESFPAPLICASVIICHDAIDLHSLFRALVPWLPMEIAEKCLGDTNQGIDEMTQHDRSSNEPIHKY